MKITLLGTGTSQGIPVPVCQCHVCTSDDPRDKRLRTSALVQTGGLSILIDTSIDFRQQMLLSKTKRIDAILLTHHHFDHLYGLDDVRAFTNAQQQHIDLYTRPDCIPEVMNRFGYAFHSGNIRHGLPALRMHPVTRRFTIGQNGTEVQVTPIEVSHGLMNIYGYRLGNFAYLTDCKTIPEHSYERLKDLDVLVIESLRHRRHPTHASVEETLGFIDRIKPRTAYLTHFSHEIKHSELEAMLPSNVRPAYDMLDIIID
ncbi:MAG: MBL fold metallo-hydrolase [Chlorobiales bacterium]|nr:MBL fold metallo-hydrolase [Chlorobiales bacterium]